MTTTECNFSCKHCLRANAAVFHLPFDIVEKAVAGAKKYGIESIHLTGGEPFLYQDLAKFFALAFDQDLPMTFSSNGSMFERHEKLLEKYKKNIRLINISCDGSKKEVHERIRGEGSFEKALKAFDFCRRHKIPFGIITCLNKENALDLDAAGIVRFAKKQKAKRITFSTVLPCRNAQDNNLILDEAQRRKVLQELLRLTQLSSFDIFRIVSIPVYIAESIFASNHIVMCVPQSLRTVTIDVDGSLHFCCFLTVYDVPGEVMKRLRLVSLKDVSFDQGLEMLSNTMGRFFIGRMNDYASSMTTDSLDFNSCFYCNAKLGIGKTVPAKD